MTVLKSPTPAETAAESAGTRESVAQHARRAARRARRPTTKTLLARVVARMVNAAAAAGLDRDALVDAAGLRGLDLANGDARVSISAQVALWQLMARGVSDPGFGVRMGASVKPREAGLLGYVMAHSATLEAALTRFVRYSRVLNEGVECSIDRPSPQHVAITQTYSELGIGLPFAVDYRLAALLSVCRQITGAPIVPVEVDFSYEIRARTSEHARFFQCPLHFGRPTSRILFSHRDMRLPMRQGDETLAEYLSEYAEQVLRSMVTGSTVVERVRSAIWNSLSEGRPTLPRIAAAVQMPPRTLQRRLANESTSLQQEVEAIRKSMAMAMLRERTVSIDEIAFLLGYPEPSTFYRSFRRWAGTTPQQYRSAQSHEVGELTIGADPGAESGTQATAPNAPRMA
jgi:AraC-like DNA-binding protein